MLAEKEEDVAKFANYVPTTDAPKPSKEPKKQPPVETAVESAPQPTSATSPTPTSGFLNAVIFDLSCLYRAHLC